MRVRLVALLVCCLGSASAYARETLPAGWFELAIPGGEATLDAMGIAPEERALTLSLIARALHDRDSRFGMAAEELARTIGAAQAAQTAGQDAAAVQVPAPLTFDAWRDVLELKRDEDLFARLVGDRAALVLAQSLALTNDTIRALVLHERGLLRFLYREGSGGFALAARSLRVDGGRVVVPGGEGADAIWQALAGAAPARPEEFIRALATRDNGRLAWYFDSIAQLDEARLRAAWPPGDRLGHAQQLYASFREGDAQVRLDFQPFRRHAADAWSVVMLTGVDDGRLAGPAWPDLWQLVFASSAVDRERAMRVLPGPRISMAWLAREIVLSPTRERRDRFEMFRLAQRVFPNADVGHAPDLAIALSGYRRYRSLLLALERMDVRTTSTWAAGVEAARFVDTHQGDDRPALAAFQGAIALVERIRHVRSITAETADALLRSLFTAVKSDRQVVPPIAKWITDSLARALPPLELGDAWTGKTAYESAILQALCGPRPRTPRSVTWEGLTYRVDRADAERERLVALRKLMPSPGLDAAIAGADRRALGDAIMAILYSVALGEPEGPAALSRDVAERHDFGLRATAIIREQRPWSAPEERQGAGPWYIQGSLIGLDLGLSRLALRRVSDGQMPRKPVLTLNDLATLTRTVVALVPDELRDADRDELAGAIARGRRRVAAATTLADVQSLAREVRLSAAGREALPWTLLRQPDVVPTLFSLRDLMWLGRPALDARQLAAWGVSGEGLDGRRVTAMPAAAAWEDFAGRSDAGQITTQVPDLTLRLIEETARLSLPAELIPALLGFAVEDYWHDTRARFADDYPRMVRQAAALESTRVEDYVAALAGGGPLRAQ